jgi:hypothetical protein
MDVDAEAALEKVRRARGCGHGRLRHGVGACVVVVQLVSGCDAYGTYITLLNSSDVDYPSMSGWELRFGKSGHVFAFPDIPFNAQSTFMIRATEQPPPGFGCASSCVRIRACHAQGMH